MPTYHTTFPSGNGSEAGMDLAENHFTTYRHIQSRDTYKQTRAAALAEWRGLLAA